MRLLIAAILTLTLFAAACTRTIPLWFDTIDDAFPLGESLPAYATHTEIPFEVDVVWGATEAAMEQHWKILDSDKETHLIRARAIRDNEVVTFALVHVSKTGPARTLVRVWIMQQESCEILSFIYYAFKPVLWAASLGTFLWIDYTTAWTYREIQRDRKCEDRAALHLVKGSDGGIPRHILNYLGASAY